MQNIHQIPEIQTESEDKAIAQPNRTLIITINMNTKASLVNSRHIQVKQYHETNQHSK